MDEFHVAGSAGVQWRAESRAGAEEAAKHARWERNRGNIRTAAAEGGGGQQHGQCRYPVKMSLTHTPSRYYSIHFNTHTVRDLSDKRMDDRIGLPLLRTFQNRLCALNLEAQIIRRSLDELPSVSSDQREVRGTRRYTSYASQKSFLYRKVCVCVRFLFLFHRRCDLQSNVM